MVFRSILVPFVPTRELLTTVAATHHCFSEFVCSSSSFTSSSALYPPRSSPSLPFPASQRSQSVLKTEVSLMRKTVLQNRMALDIIIASQEGTYDITQTECCVFISDEFANVSSLLNHMRTLINVFSDSTL